MFSFPCDEVVLNDGNISPLLSVEAVLVTLRVNGPHTVSKWKRKRIVVWLHLDVACLTVIYGTYARVYRVKPSSLHISLFLRINLLRVDFAHKVGNNLQTLLVVSSVLASCLFVIGALEVINSLLSCLGSSLSVDITSGRAKVSLIVVWSVSVDNCSEASLSTSNWSAKGLSLLQFLLY